MTREEFEEKYLKHNFFWVTDALQSEELQSILIEFGYADPTGNYSTIDMHGGFNKIVTFQPNNYRRFKYFQKVNIYNPNYSYGHAVHYPTFIQEYYSLQN